VARNGTAAGRSGEEKTGGPGGVLRCEGAEPGLGLGVPRAAAGEKTRGGGVKGAGANDGGDACAGCGRCPGGVSSMPARGRAGDLDAREREGRSVRLGGRPQFSQRVARGLGGSGRGNATRKRE